MFDDFLNNCQPEDEINPSEERIEKNIASVKSLIEKEEKDVTKRRFGLKPLIIAAAIAILSGVSLLSVSAAIQETTINFFMGGKEIEGEYYDYVDSKGFRHVTFGAVLPIDAENFAVVYDVDAPQGENVRVITEEADPDFIGKIRQFWDADKKFDEDLKVWYEEHNITQEDIRDPNSEFRKSDFSAAKALGYPEPKPEDFGLIFKDSEICTYRIEIGFSRCGGFLGGNFMHTNNPDGKPSKAGSGGEVKYDRENGTKTFKEEFYYYVGKEQTE